MALRLPSATARQIDALLANGYDLDFHTIASQFKTIYNTICARHRKLIARRAIGVDMRRPPGPPPVITREMEVYLVELLERDPDLYQDEIADYLYVEFEVEITNDQIRRALTRT